MSSTEDKYQLLGPAGGYRVYSLFPCPESS